MFFSLVFLFVLCIIADIMDKKGVYMRNIINMIFFSWIGLLFWTLLFYNVGWRVMFVPSSSMEKTLFPGDFYIANMHAYGINAPTLYNFWNPKLTEKLLIKKPEAGDVIIFEHNETLLIKRCIANEGDKITISKNNVIVNGKVNPFKNFSYYDKSIFNKANVKELFQIVPSGHCFVLGDNRNNSKDSRFIGAIPYKNIIGKASFRFISLKEDHMYKKL